jgi:zinc D-Ala-D-Ala carboxypeptidase
MTQMTKNFSLAELTKSETALRLGIENQPDEEQLNNLLLLCANVLQPVRDHFGKGVKVNSALRTIPVNRAVGSSDSSHHVKGMAADIEIPGVPNAELAEYIRDNLPFTQVILEFYTRGIPDSGWCHVSYDPQNLKRQALTAVKENGKTVYLQGIVA